MRKLAIAVTLSLCVLTPANAQGPASKWATLFLARLVPEHSGIARLYAGREVIIAQYTLGMRRLKAAGERGAGQPIAIAFLPREGLPTLEPFTWVAANGDMVRRVGDGLFILSAGNQLGNWYTDVTCRVTTWPTLFCTDTRERTISAPDLETLTLDGIPFKRPYPLAQEIPDESELMDVLEPEAGNQGAQDN